MSSISVDAGYCASNNTLVVTVSADSGTAVVHEVWGAVTRLPGEGSADLGSVSPGHPLVLLFHGAASGRVGVNATFGTRTSSGVGIIGIADNCSVVSTTTTEPRSTTSGTSVAPSTSAATTSTTEPNPSTSAETTTTSTAENTTTTSAQITEQSVPIAVVTTTTTIAGSAVGVPVTLPRTGAGDHAGAIGSGGLLTVLGVAMVLATRRRVRTVPR